MDFRGIEHRLETTGHRLEISALRPGEDIPPQHRWLAEIIYSDGRRLVASGPHRDLMAALIDLESKCTGKRRQSLQARHHDTLALDLLRNVHAVIAVTKTRSGFKLIVRDHLSRFAEVNVVAASFWYTMVEGVTATLAAVAAAHQTKFVGN